jgi:hypothetical protein
LAIGVEDAALVRGMMVRRDCRRRKDAAYEFWMYTVAGVYFAFGVMNYLTRSFLIVAIWLTLSGPAFCYDLAGEWILKVEDTSHKVVTTLTVKFTSQKAHSCIGGKWMQMTVVSSTTEDLNFYPVSDALSYEIEKDQLTIGRNEICDAYLMLSGSLNNQPVRGEYYGFGLGGSTSLGFFTLIRKK